MCENDIPEFDSPRITFSIVYDRSGQRHLHHQKILMVDNKTVFSFYWYEDSLGENTNGKEPDDFEMYTMWVINPFAQK